MRGIVLLLMLVCTACVLHASTVNRADLKSPDEITRIRTLWAIAKAGKNCGVAEADISALMTPTWEGRRQAKWCYYALGKIGEPPEKHFKTFIAAATWTEKRPSAVDDRKRTEPQWRANLEGPALPEELQNALPSVWDYALDSIVKGFSDPKTIDRTRSQVLDVGAPKNLVGKRMAKILTDAKNTMQLRYAAAYTLQLQRRCEGVTEALAQALQKDPDPQVRRTAASALSALTMDTDAYGDALWIYKHPDRDRALAALMNAMQNDPDKNVRRAASQGLRYMGPEAQPVIPQVLELIKTNKQLRAELLYIVATWKVKDAVPLFIESLNDPDPEVQTGALNALELNARNVRYEKIDWDLSSALPAIEKLVSKTKDQKVKDAATEALKSIKEIPKK